MCFPLDGLKNRNWRDNNGKFTLFSIESLLTEPGVETRLFRDESLFRIIFHGLLKYVTDTVDKS